MPDSLRGTSGRDDLWDAWRAGFDHGYECGRDDSYLVDLRDEFDRWLEDKDLHSPLDIA